MADNEDPFFARFGTTIVKQKTGKESDSNMTFRVNAQLKSDFAKVCKDNHSTPSQELKRFMNRVVKSGQLD